jgi:hypothetical protein
MTALPSSEVLAAVVGDEGVGVPRARVAQGFDRAVGVQRPA